MNDCFVCNPVVLAVVCTLVLLGHIGLWIGFLKPINTWAKAHKVMSFIPLGVFIILGSVLLIWTPLWTIYAIFVADVAFIVFLFSIQRQYKKRSLKVITLGLIGVMTISQIKAEEVRPIPIGVAIGAACIVGVGVVAGAIVAFCKKHKKPPPIDTDGDGITDDLDDDDDNDAIEDIYDNCPKVPNVEQTDRNGNGIGDACDTNIVQGLALSNPTPQAYSACVFVGYGYCEDEPTTGTMDIEVSIGNNNTVNVIGLGYTPVTKLVTIQELMESLEEYSIHATNGSEANYFGLRDPRSNTWREASQEESPIKIQDGKLFFTKERGYTIQIEESGDLKHWIPLRNTPLLVIDRSQTLKWNTDTYGSHRFYRTKIVQ